MFLGTALGRDGEGPWRNQEPPFRMGLAHGLDELLDGRLLKKDPLPHAQQRRFQAILHHHPHETQRLAQLHHVHELIALPLKRPPYQLINHANS